MLKSTQTVFFQWNSLSLGYSLISLQPRYGYDDATAQSGLESSNQAIE